MMKRWINAGGATLLAAGLCYALGVPIAPAAETAASAADDAAAQVSRGKSLFVTYGCGWCHEDGGRREAKGPQLMGTDKSDDYIMNRIATGKPGKMPAFGSMLGADDLQAIIHYIRNLKPEGASG